MACGKAIFSTQMFNDDVLTSPFLILTPKWIFQLLVTLHELSPRGCLICSRYLRPRCTTWSRERDRRGLCSPGASMSWWLPGVGRKQIIKSFQRVINVRKEVKCNNRIMTSGTEGATLNRLVRRLSSQELIAELDLILERLLLNLKRKAFQTEEIVSAKALRLEQVLCVWEAPWFRKRLGRGEGGQKGLVSQSLQDAERSGEFILSAITGRPGNHLGKRKTGEASSTLWKSYSFPPDSVQSHLASSIAFITVRNYFVFLLVYLSVDSALFLSYARTAGI